jgi:hypothetical protein
MPGHIVGVGDPIQGAGDQTGLTDEASELGYLAIGCDLAIRNLPYNPVDAFIG